MTGQELLEKMSLVDPAYIEEAEAVPEKPVKAWRKVVALAACIGVILGTIILTRPSTPGSAPTSTETTENQTDPTSTMEPTTKAPAISLVALCVSGQSDSTIGAEITSELEWWSCDCTEFQDDSAPRTLTVTFNGNSYTGTYKYSVVYMPEIYQSDYYEMENGDFSVHPETGELESFDLDDRQYGEMTAEDCLEIAEEAARQIADISEYTLTVEPGKTLHWYTFTRYIGDVKTAERISIGVSTAGLVRRFESTQLGAFDVNYAASATLSTSAAQSIEALFSEQADAVLEEKINMMYAGLDEAYPDSDPTLSYEVTESRLVMLPDNTLGVLQTVETDVTTTVENGYIQHNQSLFYILVKCEQPSDVQSE